MSENQITGKYIICMYVWICIRICIVRLDAFVPHYTDLIKDLMLTSSKSKQKEHIFTNLENLNTYLISIIS